jgi:hypothetical protein
MRANQQSFSWTIFASRFRTAPLELKAFAVFSVVVTVLDLSLTFLAGHLGLQSWPQQVVPITGWGASGGYMFTIFFAFLLIYGAGPRWRRMRLGIVAILLVKMLGDLCAYTNRYPASSDNPYLIISPWRPLWIVVLPAIWIAILCSPRIRRFCDAGIDEMKESRAAKAEEVGEPTVPLGAATKESGSQE